MKKTIRYSVIRLALQLLGSIGPALSLTAQAPLFQRIDSTFQAMMDSDNVPGALFAMVSADSILKLQAYGLADVENNIPAHPEHTAFRLASVSKALTATAVMRLVSEGRLLLDEDVNHYLRTFQLEEKFGKLVTLRHLLSHTAGFDTEGPGRRTLDPSEVVPMPPHFANYMPKRVLPPGELITYSNYAGSLPGCLAEDYLGIPFDAWMQETLFRPLGMTNSGFVRDSFPDGALAKGYFFENGEYVPAPFEYTHTISGSMLMSTAADMARFLQFHLRQGEFAGRHLLSKEIMKLMHERQFSMHPKLEGTTLGLYELEANGQFILTHSGGFDGFMAQLYLLPEQGIGFFMAFNQRWGGAEINRAVRQLIFDDYLPETPPYEPEPAIKQPLHRFEGTYFTTNIAQTNLSKLQAFPAKYQWAVQAAGKDSLIFFGSSYVPITPLVFRPANGEKGYAVFREDDQGDITHITFGGFFTTHRRLAWYEKRPVQLGVLIFCGSLFIATLVLAPLQLWRYKSDGRRFYQLALAVSSLFILPFAGSLFGLEPGRYGVPLGFKVLQALLIVASLGAVVSALLLPGFLQRAAGRQWRRAYGVLFTLAGLLFVSFLWYWCLL